MSVELLSELGHLSRGHLKPSVPFKSPRLVHFPQQFMLVENALPTPAASIRRPCHWHSFLCRCIIIEKETEMKHFTIAIIAAALLLALGGCVYSGEPSVSGYYSYGYPYTPLYSGAYYDNYSWPYRYGFNSYRYRQDVYNHGRQPDRTYRHGQRHHDNRQQAVHKRHKGSQRVDNRPHQWKSQPHRDRRATGPFYGSDRQGFGRHSGNRGNRIDGRHFSCFNGRC